MKKIIRKTEKEREATVTNKEVKVEDTNYFYWECDNCNVAFFAGDTILQDSKGIHRCPLGVYKHIIGNLYFRNKIVCGNHMYGGDEEYFNKHYKLSA